MIMLNRSMRIWRHRNHKTQTEDFKSSIKLEVPKEVQPSLTLSSLRSFAMVSDLPFLKSSLSVTTSLFQIAVSSSKNPRPRITMVA